MNLLGKILTVLILLSSIVFLTLALIIGASHQNWQKKAMELKAQAQQENEKVLAALALTKKKDAQLRAEQVARTYRVASLNNLKISAESDEKTKEQSLEAAQKELVKLTNQNETAQKSIAEKQATIDQLRKDNSELVDQIRDVRKAVVELTNQKFGLQGQVNNLKEQQKSLQDLTAKLTRVLRIEGLDLQSPIGHIPPKDVTGEVIAVNRGGHFSINIGSDDGLRENHRVNIYRGDRFVGEAIVIDVKHNSATARIIEDLNKLPLRIKDYVTTKR